MVGFDNEDISFVFELTYNYGVYSYKRGNDLLSINLHRFNQYGDDIQKKLLESFEGVEERDLEKEGVPLPESSPLA